jgi:hypothetical protein
VPKVLLEPLKDENKLENDLVRGWVHTQYSYILRRTESKESALRFIEKAIASGLATPGVYYNGACYLVEEDKERARQYLNAAIEKDFSFFMEALLDPDLKEIVKDYIPPRNS